VREVAVAALDSLLHARSYLARPRVIPAALPVCQRIATLLMRAWMAGTGVAIIRGDRQR